MLFPTIFLGVLLALAFSGFRVLKEYERGVVFRLGRFNGVRTAGLKWIIPGVDRMVRVSLREIVMDVPSQEVITRDNVSVKVNAVLYFRVLHPEKAVILRGGSDVTLVSTGYMTQFAYKVANELSSGGISVDLLHYPSVKPKFKRL